MTITKIIREHEEFFWDDSIRPVDLYKCRLIKYENNNEFNRPAGFYAYYRIGAEWLNQDTPLVVTPKSGLERINFLKMLSVCFSNNIDAERLSSVYKIFPDEKPIKSTAFKSVLSPLIILHYISLVKAICRRGLKKDYIITEDNLNSVKGSISIPHNERVNVIPKRLNKTYCVFSEYSLNCMENRVIKKALLLAEKVLFADYKDLCNASIKRSIRDIKNHFSEVNDIISTSEILHTKNHKLYPDYKEALKLAKIILRQFDMQISAKTENQHSTIPFHIDMSLLYELYVYGLLYEQYGKKIIYQYNSITGKPDFLYVSDNESLIIDTKYKPSLNENNISTSDLRQLSGYSRDLNILNQLRIKNDIAVNCLFIYPREGDNIENPFKKEHPILSLDTVIPCHGLLKMHKLCVPLPTLYK